MDTHSCRTQLENKVISPWHFCNYMSLGRELPGWQEGPFGLSLSSPCQEKAALYILTSVGNWD